MLTFKDNNHNHRFGIRRLKTQSIKNGICGVASIDEKVFESPVGNSTESTNYGKFLCKKNQSFTMHKTDEKLGRILT